MATERDSRGRFLKGPSTKEGVSIHLEPGELLRQLQRLDKKTKAKVARKVLRAASRPILRDAKQRVPEVTGDLKRSLKIRTSVKRGSATASVRATERYAHLVELGTKPHSMTRRNKGGTFKRRRQHPGADPKPYLRPAFDTKKDEAVAKARTVLAAELRKVTKGSK